MTKMRDFDVKYKNHSVSSDKCFKKAEEELG